MDGLFLLYIMSVTIGFLVSDSLHDRPRTTIHFTPEEDVAE